MWGQYSAAARDLTPEEKLKVVRQVRAALPPICPSRRL